MTRSEGFRTLSIHQNPINPFNPLNPVLTFPATWVPGFCEGKRLMTARENDEIQELRTSEINAEYKCRNRPD